MSTKNTLHNTMRVYHRYLGFFLAGIMAVYSVSGIILIFRNVDFLKREVHQTRTLQPNLTDKQVGEELRIKELKFENADGAVHAFKQGTYNSETGVADFTLKQYPFLIDKMTHLHKATAKDPLFYFNIFFGLSLFFFVLSSFWMFLPKTSIFKKGLYFTAAGIVLMLVMLFVG